MTGCHPHFFKPVNLCACTVGCSYLTGCRTGCWTWTIPLSLAQWYDGPCSWGTLIVFHQHLGIFPCTFRHGTFTSRSWWCIPCPKDIWEENRMDHKCQWVFEVLYKGLPLTLPTALYAWNIQCLNTLIRQVHSLHAGKVKVEVFTDICALAWKVQSKWDVEPIKV